MSNPPTKDGLWVNVIVVGTGMVPGKVIEQRDHEDPTNFPTPETIEEVWDWIAQHGTLDCVSETGLKLRFYRANMGAVSERVTEAGVIQPRPNILRAH